MEDGIGGMFELLIDKVVIVLLGTACFMERGMPGRISPISRAIQHIMVLWMRWKIIWGCKQKAIKLDPKRNWQNKMNC